MYTLGPELGIIYILGALGIVDSKKLEDGHSMSCDGCPSVVGLGVEDGHIPTFWSQLQTLTDAQKTTWLFLQVGNPYCGCHFSKSSIIWDLY